jgi:soluble lytic murein transglycosylase-like protein
MPTKPNTISQEKKLIINLATPIAKSHSLPPHIVIAIIEQESNFNPFALRFEPAWYRRLLPKANEPNSPILSPTEIAQRSISWGLMQVLGQTLRELQHRFQEPKLRYLTPLCHDQSLAITWGCRILQHKLQRTGDLHAAILAYNGGARPAYLSEVIAKSHQYAT